MNLENSLEEAFSRVQRAIEQRWERCLKSIHACQREEIAARFHEFAALLRRQIQFEEEVLFPAMAPLAKTLENDPIVLTSAEHREIEATLDLFESRIEAHDCASLYGQHVGPSALFRSHVAGEQNVLYPIADLLIPATTRAQIIESARGLGLAA